MKDNNRDYFKIDLSSINCGLLNHRFNLEVIIKYCFMNNLKLVKPKFILSSNHNNGREIVSDLSEYYDLKNIKINGEKFKLYNDAPNIKTFKKRYRHGLVTSLAQFENVNEEFKKLGATLDMQHVKEIKNIASKIHSKLKNYMCIHVRRGDRCHNEQIDKDTKPENIKAVIKRYRPESIYIMTNRLDEIKELREVKNLYFYDDFEDLKNIKDNYFLFSVENDIMKNASVRVTTFSNFNPQFFDCSLSKLTQQNNPVVSRKFSKQ